MSDLENQRNRELIKEREAYEKEYDEDFKKQIEQYEASFLDNVVEDMLDSDEFNMLMMDRLEYINDNFDFEPSPAYEEIEQFYYAEMEEMFDGNVKTENWEFPIAEDGSDIEGYDYPKGYNDVPFDYPNQRQYFDEDIPDYPDQPMDFKPPEYEISQLEYQEYLMDSVISSEDEHMEKLIQEHLQEEQDYLDGIVKQAIQEDNIIAKAVDRAIFDRIDLEYEDQSIDYADSQQYWCDETDDDEIDSLIKDYFKRDDALDNLIEEKLKNKKFKR